MIIKVTPDKERVKSMIKLIENRLDFVKTINEASFSTIAAEHYYEIIKELAASILLLDGIKTIGETAHKELIESLAKYKEMEEYELKIINDLRIKRNKSYYEGKKIDSSYLENKKAPLIKIIGKLKTLLNKKITKEK